MGGKDVALARHLHVRACKLPAGTVVVHHEVVRSKRPGVAHDLVVDVLDERGVWRAAKERVDGVAHK